MTAQPLQVKFVEGGDEGLIEILSVPFGGPLPGGIAGKDWSGEYFSPRTNLHLDMFPGPAKPLLYDHGTSELIGWDLIGKALSDTIHQDDLGWWVQAQLDRHGRYYSALKALIDKQALYGSTGAPSALVRKAADGEILDWPWFEQTLTPIPCNILSRVQPAMAKKHYEAAGLAFPALGGSDGAAFPATAAAIARATAAARRLNDLLTKAGGYNPQQNDVGASGAAEFAFVDKDGRGHLPIGDAAHVRAALARFDQTQFPDDATKAKAKAKILAAAKKFGIDVAGADGEKMATFDTKAGQVLNKTNLAHVQSIHDHAKSMAASMGADACK
jgi:hypothetical protein